jgi:excisionase family DNA binding protein
MGQRAHACVSARSAAVTGRLLTAREVAGMLAVSPETVLRWARAGKVPSVRLPSGAIRFVPDQIDVWLERSSRGSISDRPHAL